MIYETADDWRGADRKRVLLFGMSGLGKTHVSNLLRDGGGWFHYSIDYRIGTRYMGEHIVDNFKREAMKVPFLRELLMSDSIYIGSNITFDNLAPLSTYLGKPGDPAKGGLPLRRIHGAAGTAPRRRNRRPAGHRAFHRPRLGHLRLPAFRLRHRRLDLRGGGPRRPRRPGPDRAGQSRADGLDRRHPRRTPTNWSAASTARRNRCATSRTS